MNPAFKPNIEAAGGESDVARLGVPASAGFPENGQRPNRLKAGLRTPNSQSVK
jgi:hypothetical protein